MAEEPEGISATEYRGRLDRARAAVEAAGLVGLVAFGDCWRGANVGYFTDFRPLDGVSDIASALVVLPVDREATLVVSEQCLGYAASVTGFPVRRFRDLDPVLAPLARHPGARVGLAGDAYVPASAFYMNRTTKFAVRGLTDASSSGKYVFIPSFQAGVPDVLLGAPIESCRACGGCACRCRGRACRT